MRRWFLALPIHRKLVITSMAKTTAVLLAAMITLLALDAFRFQRNATASAAALAAIVAENVRVAIVLQDTADVTQTLSTVRLQLSVQTGCVYDAEGVLVSQYARDETSHCAAAMPTGISWSELAASAPVERDGTTVGHVYVSLSWAALRTRMWTAGVTSLVVLILAALVMLFVSDRLHRGISDPITQLAAAARVMGQGETHPFPRIQAGSDEVGELVRAFEAMVDRVRTTNQNLTQTNDALRREVEERREIEIQHEASLVREREANRVKDEFLATVSHELRTPLNAIVGWTRILITTTPDADMVARAASSLHRNALAQARVIDDLIDISRIVTGKLRVVAEPVDLCQVVESAVEAIRPTAERAGITLTVDVPAEACVINGDRDRLQQVVWNLLSNAVKFASRGTVHIRLATDAGMLRLVVSDTGIGIRPEFLPHVFDRFRQADATSTREHGGLGIGLAIAKELVELHGGSIRAESAGPGKGAAFTVQLPQAEAHPALAGAADAVPSLVGISVLAVDDNLDALEIIDLALRQAGATVRLASSAAEALALWGEAPSDVLLCDLAMPFMSGFDLLARIRELDRAAGRLTPAIAVTAHATEEQIARSAHAGFQMHVSKPFDAQRLVGAISTARTLV